MGEVYRRLREEELSRALFAGFERRQAVTRCWRREAGAWVIRDAPFIDDWDEGDYALLLDCLRATLRGGGVVIGAFHKGVLKGFASVEGSPWGSSDQYRDLTSLHVSADMRGQGMGKRLLALAADWAKGQGAQKLYISAHSAVETQAFYRAQGCVEAREYNPEHVRQEPFDCQMELPL